MTIRRTGKLLAIVCLLVEPARAQDVPGWPLPERTGVLDYWSMAHSGAIDPCFPRVTTTACADDATCTAAYDKSWHRNVKCGRTGYCEVTFCPTECWLFDQAVGATYTGDCSGKVFTVNGSPTRVTDGTWPAGPSGSQGYSWFFNGSTAYLSLADDDDFDPAGDFSIICIIRTPTVAAGEACLLAKYETTGNQKGWKLCRSGSSMVFTTSANGSADTAVTKTSALVAYVPSFITATYQASTTTGVVYVDALSAATSNSMGATVYNNTALIEVAASDTGATLYSGLTYACYYYKELVIASTEHLARFAQWQGRMSASGSTMSVTWTSPSAVQVAPANSGTEPFLMVPPPNSNMVSVVASGEGGLARPAAVTNIARRSSYESWTTDATCTNKPTGVAVWCVAGNGSARMEQDTTNVAHGGSSVKITLTGTTSYGRLHLSPCQTNKNLYFLISIYAKCTVGACNQKISLIEYSDGACNNYVTDNTLITYTPSSTWTKYSTSLSGPGYSWNAATNSYHVSLYEQGDNGIAVNLDSLQILSSASSLPLETYGRCHCDTDADCSCTTPTTMSVPSLIPANGPAAIKFTARTPWAGTDITTLAAMLSDGTPGVANAITFFIAPTSDEPVFFVYDAAAGQKYVLPDVLNWTANTSYTIVGYFDGRDDGNHKNMRLWWNNTWQTTTYTYSGGTGTRSASQTSTHIGGSDSAGADVLIRDYTVCSSWEECRP